jgi:hypothetical protein
MFILNGELNMSNAPVVIKADVFWCSNYVRSKQSEKYQVDLCNLSAQAVQALAMLGIEAKRDDVKKAAQGFYITCKSRDYCIVTVDKDDKPLGEFVRSEGGTGTEVKLDEQGKPIYTKIANGSKAIATISSYDTMVKGKKFTQGSVKKLVITDLIEYKPEGIDLSKLEEEAL